MQKPQTNLPDWSALIPVLPAGGPRREALQAELRRLIETRVLLPGQKLPPSRELARRLKLARGAVVATYEQLAADGFVEARLGAGTYVAAFVPEHVAQKTAPRTEAKTGPPPPMPGKLGSGTVDDKTLRDLRGLFRTALMRLPPGFLHYGDPFGDLQLRREKQQADIALEREKLEAELALKQQEMAVELELRRAKLAMGDTGVSTNIPGAV